VRLLHTGDWQLGLRLNFVGGEAAARLRAWRFETVRHIGELARAQAVDLVVVAGDVFDDNGVGADTLQQARDALSAFGDVPVVLLPGNHDPATPDSALARLGNLPGRVHVALTAEVLRFDGFEVWPCPLTARHAWQDPTASLPAAPRDDRVRIVVAHGGALDFGEPAELPNRIDVTGILARGYDYVALGDWHGIYRVTDRAWYAGAPEATRFKEKRPGHVLLVDLAGPGAAPQVTEVPVARTRWLTASFRFTEDQSVDDLVAWLESLDEKSATLVELALAGQLSLAGRERLDALLEDYRSRLALLRVDSDQVTAAPTAEDLALLHGEGFLGRAIAALRDSDDPVDRDALRLLYRLTREQA
jgi:DNA repair exonuclease SbcCD nuclease subunit